MSRPLSSRCQDFPEKGVRIQLASSMHQRPGAKSATYGALMISIDRERHSSVQTTISTESQTGLNVAPAFSNAADFTSDR